MSPLFDTHTTKWLTICVKQQKLCAGCKLTPAQSFSGTMELTQRHSLQAARVTMNWTRRLRTETFIQASSRSPTSGKQTMVNTLVELPTAWAPLGQPSTYSPKASPRGPQCSKLKVLGITMWLFSGCQDLTAACRIQSSLCCTSGWSHLQGMTWCQVSAMAGVVPCLGETAQSTGRSLTVRKTIHAMWHHWTSITPTSSGYEFYTYY